MHSSESNLPGLSIGACSVMSSHGGRSKHDPALIHHALQRVVAGESLNSIAKAAGIPEATLRRYKHQPETIDRCAGPPTILSDEEELGLATAALWLKEHGLPLDALQLKRSAKDIAEARGKTFKSKQGLPSDDWFHAFINRKARDTFVA